jgi:hypothetical protein
MTNPDDLENIITGAFSLLGLIGVPIAIVAAPVVQIVRGVIGLTNSREERKEKKKQKAREEINEEIAQEGSDV